MSDAERGPGRPRQAVTKRPRRVKGEPLRQPAKIEGNVKYLLQISQEEKSRLETLAEAAKCSLGELIRRILAAYR